MTKAKRKPRQPQVGGDRTDDAGKLLRREKFIAGMVEHGNQTRAAMEAGFSQNKRSAAELGRRLMLEPDVADEVARRKTKIVEKAEKRAEISLTRLLEELSHSAFFDPMQLFDVVDGKIALKALDKMPESARRALASLKLNDDGNVVEIRPNSKLDAIEKGLKALGAYRDNDGDSAAAAAAAAAAAGGGVHIHVHGGPMGFEVEAKQTTIAAKSGDKKTAVTVRVGK